MAQLDYSKIKDELLQSLSLRELETLVSIVGYETNIKKIHNLLDSTLNSENVADSAFHQGLMKKVSDKQIDFYHLIHLSIAVANKDFSLTSIE